ncbi:MAG: hypothetical protein VKO21_12670 [Candidatus Sericytochromatia bacterium]|nr:hypothetical protein [Candidatus Sericytochromatia bacterium]
MPDAPEIPGKRACFRAMPLLFEERRAGQLEGLIEWWIRIVTRVS